MVWLSREGKLRQGYPTLGPSSLVASNLLTLDTMTDSLINDTQPDRDQDSLVLATLHRPSNSPLPTAIQSLPPELLIRILQLGDDSYYSSIHSSNYPTFLLSSALVCSTWTKVALTLLWNQLGICTETKAKKLLSSPAWGRYRTQKLKIENRFFWSQDFVDPVIVADVDEGVKGVEDLVLQLFQGEHKLDSLMLLSPNLYGYVTLELSTGGLMRLNTS